MSLLRKIISTISSDHAQQATAEFPPAMPAANCLATEVALVDRPLGELEEDDNPTKQRRYYVKTGRYVDYRRGFGVTIGECPRGDFRQNPDRPQVAISQAFPALKNVLIECPIVPAGDHQPRAIAVASDPPPRARTRRLRTEPARGLSVAARYVGILTAKVPPFTAPARTLSQDAGTPAR